MNDHAALHRPPITGTLLLNLMRNLMTHVMNTLTSARSAALASGRPVRAGRAAVLLLGLATLLGGCSEAPPPGPLAPIEALRGKWVIVNYWAEWCKPCIREVPELNMLDQREDISVLGVNFDGASGEQLLAQTEALGIRFRELEQDPAAALGIARPEVLPTSIVISPEGGVHQVLVGVQTADSLLAATVGSRPSPPAR